MKTSTIHSLITARTLYDEALRLVDSGDRHMCSAGLILLQDALEIVMLALLVEKGVDEHKALEAKTFDELIGELKKAGIAVPKSGTLKALNKQRVITKHYGQLAEPATVRGYADAAESAMDSIIPQVLGKRLREVFLTDLMDEGEAREFLTEASMLVQQGKYLEALISVRRAIFVEIEHEYAIHNWADADPNEPNGLLSMSRGGMKAHYWTRNREWISTNVRDPLDYIQVDHERLRLDGMEWGVNTAELENLRRLTPDVFRPKIDAPWHVQYDLEFPSNDATPSNASYCLDRAISIILRKQRHTKAKLWPSREISFDPPTIYLDAAVFEKASQDSKVVHRINSEFGYTTSAVVTGFNPVEKYYRILGRRPDPDSKFGLDWIFGFLLVRPEENI